MIILPALQTLVILLVMDLQSEDMWRLDCILTDD